MQYPTDFHFSTPRLFPLLDELTCGCDPEFDDPESDLALEFAEFGLSIDRH
jgi:hypothetical protein